MKTADSKVKSAAKEIAEKAVSASDIVLVSEKMNTLNDISGATPVGEACGTLYKTMQYDAFTFMESNRPVTRTRINKLKREILEEGLLVPLVVNTKLEFSDGQGRFLALQELGLEIVYIIRNTENIHVAKMNNTSTKWDAKSWTNLWTKEGENQEDYIYFDKTFDLFNAKHEKVSVRQNELRALVMGEDAFNKAVRQTFDRGQMKITKSKSEIEDMLTYITVDLPKIITDTFPNSRKIQRTIFHLLQQPIFDKDQFNDMITKPKNTSLLISPAFLSLPQKMLTNEIIKMYNKQVRKGSLKIKEVK